MKAKNSVPKTVNFPFLSLHGIIFIIFDHKIILLIECNKISIFPIAHVISQFIYISSLDRLCRSWCGYQISAHVIMRAKKLILFNITGSCNNLTIYYFFVPYLKFFHKLPIYFRRNFQYSIFV